MIQTMLTTEDNPYDPFDEFDAWHAWDTRAGYHTASLVARICVSSHDLSDADYSLAIAQAIDEILAEGTNPKHRKVTREFPDEQESV